MFVVNPKHPPQLLHYGINLPVDPTRFINCKEWVKQNVSDNFQVELDQALLDVNDLALVHSADYLQRLETDPASCIKECYELDIYPHRYLKRADQLSFAELAHSTIFHSGGTYLAAKLALENQFCFFVGGGYHHARANRPGGFCLVNDIVIAIRKLQKEGRIKTAWVIDVDVHMGDGTAQLTQSDNSIVTFSIHMQSGWPLNDPNFDHNCASDIDVLVPSHANHLYLSMLEQGLQKLAKYPTPDLVIVNQGTDPYEKDALKSSELISLTSEQMLQRDKLVYHFLKDRELPQAYVLSGGYGPHAHEPTLAFWQYLSDKALWKRKSI